ncbi:hypothetical protein cypCar_00028214 [Cyprinus carpio]|nr:hypothetical protein cypCar_00028214 [Cyprinus carpio]
MCQVEEECNGLECKQEKIPVPTLVLLQGLLYTQISGRAGKESCHLSPGEVITNYRKGQINGISLVKKSEKPVLLAVSGGAASCSMLSQVQEVFNLPTSALVPGPSDPDPSNPSYKQAVDQYIKEKQTLTEESVASAVAQLSIEDSAYLPEHKLALERLFSSLKTLTAKEDML